MEKIAFTGSELLSAKKLTKYYGKKCILDNISFTANQGETVAITGKSGAGKSTLLSLLGTLDTPTSGEILFQGRRLNSRNSRSYRRDSVGFVFQDSCLIDEFTAYENVLSAIKLSKSGEDPLKYLELVGLSDKKTAYPEKLSGGEARRVSLARALAKRPKLLLLDEPTEGLDGETGLEIMNLTLELSRLQDITVIMVTHNEAHAGLMSRRLYLEGGRLTDGGSE